LSPEEVEYRKKMADATSDFLCPITHELMTDPVIDPNGNNYERSAIENWLKEQSESPVVSSILRAKTHFCLILCFVDSYSSYSQ
jgi:hypothetical protein